MVAFDSGITVSTDRTGRAIPENNPELSMLLLQGLFSDSANGDDD